MAKQKPSINKDIEVKGIKIHYEYYGRKDSPVVVINNGVAMETTSWYYFLPPILEKVDVLLWDFRGQGQSSCDDNLYQVEDLADYLKAILEDLEVDPKWVHLVGISFGSLVVTEFLRKYPQMVHKAVLSGVILSNERNYQYQIELGKKIIEQGFMDIWADSLYAGLFSDNFLKTIESLIPKLKEALFERYKDRKRALYRLLEAEGNYLENIENLYNDFKKIENPLMVIAGEHDRLTPPYVQKKAEKILNLAKYMEFPECGHVVYMERPKEFFSLVVDFISR